MHYYTISQSLWERQVDEGFLGCFLLSPTYLWTFSKGCNYWETAELTLPRHAPLGRPSSRDHTQPHDAILLKQNMAGKVTPQQPPRAGLISEVLVTRIHFFSWPSLQSTGLGSRAAVTQLLQPWSCAGSATATKPCWRWHEPRLTLQNLLLMVISRDSLHLFCRFKQNLEGHGKKKMF